LLKKEHARVDWKLDAEAIAWRVRAFFPWPVAFAELEGTKVKIFKAEVAAPSGGSPGETSTADNEGITVACGSGTCLRLLEVQAEGKNKMAAGVFARGQRLASGILWG
jgi:methionyl-tRNA formyltransferase